MAVESDTQIFVTGLYDNPQTPEETDGPALMTELCGRTGGANIIIHDVSVLRDAMGKATELSQQAMGGLDLGGLGGLLG